MRPGILVPEAEDSLPDVQDLLLPKSFVPDTGAQALIHSEKKFFLKNLSDPESVARLTKRLIVYFSRPLDGWYDETRHDREGREIVERRPYKAPLPMLTEFANMHGVTERELKQAARSFPDLARALEFARDVMKTSLVRKGLTEEYSPNFAKFVATSETGMVEKTEHLEKRVTMNLNELAKQIQESNEPLIYDDSSPGSAAI